MISCSESSVNNWWESDGLMKGVYQGLMNHNRNSQKIFGTNRGPNGNAQTMLYYDHTWFPRDTHSMDWIYWDLMVIILQINFHQVRSQTHHVQMIMRGTTVY